MRTRTLVVCGVALAAICLILWSRQRTEPGKNAPPPVEVVPAQSPQPEAPTSPTAPVRGRVADSKPVTASGTPSAQINAPFPRITAEQSNTAYQVLLAAWQAPIEFYGRVVDENSNAVAGASIQFRWIETPSEGGERKSSMQSDATGLFSLRGKTGRSLTVWVNKEGYYASHGGQQTFLYAATDAVFRPDSQNPVLFRLRRRGPGEPLVHVGGIGLRTMRDFLLAPDGKPTEVSLRDGRSVPAGQGDLRVEFQAGAALDNFPSRITWQCRVTVPDGGLVQTDEEYPFLAPESGYSGSDEWSIGATNWTEQVQKVYYVKLHDGSFGRATVRVIGTARRAFFRMESSVNPSGSRNLEPASNGQ